MAAAIMTSLKGLKLNKRISSRTKPNLQTVAGLVRAYKSGATIPPLVADKKTKILVDGTQRRMAAMQLKIKKLPVEFRNFKDIPAMLEASMLLNRHGQPLSTYDKVNCILKADRCGLPRARLARAMAVTEKYLDRLYVKRTCDDNSGNAIAVKASYLYPAHDTGRLTKKQETVQFTSIGQSPLRIVNELISLFETKALDRNDAVLTKRVLRLRDLIDRWL